MRQEDWAEEVLQDCYIRIWNHAGDYRAGLAAPMTWMTSIVRNRCLDWLRRASPEVIDDRRRDRRDASESDGPGRSPRWSGRRRRRRSRAASRELEAKQRQAILLAFYDGLSHSELAQHLREPLGTVKTWVRRGLAKLKTCLGARAGT